MLKHNILFITPSKSKKNLSTLYLLYSLSNNIKTLNSNKFVEGGLINLHNFTINTVNISTIHYHNKLNIMNYKEITYIQKKIIDSIKTFDNNLAYITYLHNKIWLVNRLTHLSSNFYLASGGQRLLFKNRLKRDPKNLLRKLYRNVRYRKEKSKLISYWQYPIKYRYNKKKNKVLMFYRSNFNRVLINNLINLLSPGYFRIFFNIFRHFTKLISKRIMLLYLNDYNFFRFFIKKKYNKLTVKWFRIFSSVSDNSTDHLFCTNYIRPTMFKRGLRSNLIKLYRKRQTYMYSWLYAVSVQELLKKFDLKLLYVIKYIYLMRGKRYKRIFERSRKLVFNAPISNKKFLMETVNIFCISFRTRDPKFIFDFLFKYFNTMHFRLQFRFISFLKSFVRHNFGLFKEYYRIKGLRILIKGKIGKTGSVRKKKMLLSYGKIGYANLRLRMDERVGPMFTPTGVIGARVIITY